ncbi:MAG: signal recognition particle receptor subunit alpha, partial [Candidatus Micrarchaeia archaeon]
MFNLLKDKLSSFVKSISKKVEEQPQKEVKLSLETKVRSVLSQEVEIREKDVSGLLEELELSLLEADVAYEAANGIAKKLRGELVGKRVRKNEVDKTVNEVIRKTLLEIMEKEKPDLVGMAKQKASSGAPFVVLFIGPNGSGKTTSIAKIANLLKMNGVSCVIAAADTWRAASQEQAEVWGKRVGVKVIGGQYGSDPTSVVWNAVAHAKAKGVNAVLVDTAGRQETSRNLMKELEKMNRVIKPDLKIYVGEAVAGNSVIEQVKEFDKAIGIDGVILTKADVDEKGGAAL